MSETFPTFAEGRYRIESRLGDGGMAAVFRAWDTRLHVYRAIKCLDPNLSVHPNIRERFEVEARTMASMSHPNIVAVQDIGNIGFRFFIIMELLTGGSLWDRISKHGPLDPQYAIDAAIAIAKGLGAAHKQNIIHRDVKPHNVLISKEGVLKVTDFGIARIDGGGNKTKTGVVMGTLNYMAPEQRLSASRVTAVSDLYAVGASLYAALTGKSNENLFDAKEQDIVLAELAEPIATFLRKACHRDPEMRHADADAMVEDLVRLKTQIDPAREDAIPLFVPFESDNLAQKPSSEELTSLHTSWSQYGAEDAVTTSSDTSNHTLNLFDDEFEETQKSEPVEQKNLAMLADLSPPETTDVQKSSSSPPVAAILVAVALLIFAGLYVSGNQTSNVGSAEEAVAADESKDVASKPSSATITETSLSLSTVALVPFAAQSDNAKVKILATGLFQDVSSGLSQSVSKLNIMPLRESPEDLSQEARRIKAGYIIDGNLQSFEDNLRVNVKLLDTEKMSIIWSKTFKRDMSNQDIFTIQDEIVRQIVDALVGNGFIMAEDVQKKAQRKGAKDLSVYECRNFAYRFYKTYLPDDYEKVNECLRASLKVDPDYAELYYHLAHINFVAWQMGYKTGDDIILEAIEHADKCIALDPSNPQGYFGKGILSFVIKDWSATQKYLRKAVDMAPNNVEILSNAGIILITGGECSLEQYRDKEGKKSSYTEGDCQWKPGWEMLQKAFELDKGNLYPVKNYGIAHVYNIWGEYEKAYNQMQLAVSPGFIWYEMHSAIAAAGMKDEALAKKHFDAVKEIIDSNKLDDAHAHFHRWHIPQYWEMSRGFLVDYGFE